MPDRTPPAVLGYITERLRVEPAVTAVELRPGVAALLGREVSLRSVRDYLGTARRRSRTPRPPAAPGARVWLPAATLARLLALRSRDEPLHRTVDRTIDTAVDARARGVAR